MTSASIGTFVHWAFDVSEGKWTAGQASSGAANPTGAPPRVPFTRKDETSSKDRDGHNRHPASRPANKFSDNSAAGADSNNWRRK